MSVAYKHPETCLADVHTALDAYGCNPKPIIGDKFTSRCPAHDDNDPSLSISTGDKGIILHCFAGCQTIDILNAIGFDYSDIFYETTSSEPEPLRLASHTQTASVIKLAGSYIDPEKRERLLTSHNLIAQIEHERCISKDTLALTGCGLDEQQRVIIPTFDRDGEPAPRAWLALADQRTPGKPKIKGPAGAKPDLWPRPETPRYKDNDEVIIVEGEPDALVGITHNLNVIGLPGVNTWQHADAERFTRFSHVTILLDDDDVGREASRNIARDLRSLGINTTERHHTNGKPTRRDLTDLAREETNLKAAIEKLSIVTPDTLYNNALQTVDINQMLDTEPEQRVWIWDNYFSRGTLNMIHGAGGLGKSMIGLALAGACTRSIPTSILGHTIMPTRVSIIDAENSLDEIHRRLRTAGIQHRDKINYYRTDVTILGQAETRDLFHEIAKHSDIVILDSQRGLWDGDEKEQAEAGRMLRDLARIAETTGLCIIVIHHDTKQGQYSGSSDIDAAISGSRLHIQRANDPKKRPADDDDESWMERILTHAKCRIGAEQRPIKFKMTIDDHIWLQIVTGPTGELENLCERITEWARTHDAYPSVPVTAIKAQFGYGTSPEERNRWRPVGEHLRAGRYARKGKSDLVVEFITDTQMDAA